MKPKLCIVKWRDAHYASDEVSVEDAKKRHKAVYYISSGILVSSDSEGVTLAMDYGLPLEETDGHSWRTRSFIPRELIEYELNAGSLLKAPKNAKVTPPTPASNTNSRDNVTSPATLPPPKESGSS